MAPCFPPSSRRHAALLIAAVLAAASPACSKPAAPPAQAQAVKVAIVGRAAGAGSSRYSAHIEPATKLDLAFKVGGYVDSIAKVKGVDGRLRLVQEGDAVAPGEELAVVRKTDYAQKLAEAKASYAQAKAARGQAHTEYGRTSKLAEQGSVSTAEVDAMRTKLETARAVSDGAKARLDEASTAMADATLKSPMAGVILRRAVEVGSLAAAGTVGFSIADVSTVKAVFGVPDTVLPRVRVGATQSVTTEAFPGVQFHGRITRVAPSADARSRVFEAEVTIPNGDDRLKAGMVAALALDAAAPPAAAGTGEGASRPLVPLSAIVRAPDRPQAFAVFVVEDVAGKAVVRAREVELGEYLGQVIPVSRGLQGGERIVVQGAGLLSSGETVEILP